MPHEVLGELIEMGIEIGIEASTTSKKGCGCFILVLLVIIVVSCIYYFS